MTRVDATAMRRAPLRARVAWLHVVLGLGAVAVFFLGPAGLQTPISALVLIAGMTAIHLGPRFNLGPADRTPWRLLIVAGYLYIVAALIRVAVPETLTIPPPPIALVPDLITVPAYLCMGYALAVMLRRRRAAEDDPARVDAVLMGLAFAFLIWSFVIAPSFADKHMSVIQLIDALFPVIDVVLVTLVAQLIFAGGARTAALWLMMAGSTAMFAADLLFSLRDTGILQLSQRPIDGLFLVMFVLMPAAAWHPSTRTLVEPQQVVVHEMSRLRLVVIGLVVVVPTIVTSLMPLGATAYDLIRAILCALIVLSVLARVVRSNNSRVRAERATRRRATHDGLTDLPNRELLSETIARWAEQAVDEHLEVSLLFIDLDRFKMINDHWGHQVGDELLCSVASRLSEQVRSEDVVARIGGDEFVIALASPSHLRLAESLADRLLCEFARPYALSVGDVVISASIGVAKSTGGAHALELIRDADTAMYKAKGSGRNSYALFDNSLREQVRDRVKLEQSLRGALERGELAVHFQPIVDLRGEQLDGFEALMRWDSPELGSVSPMEFIPIAEETGMIEQMGAWLLRESARQLLAWTDIRGPGARPLHVSVNVSVRQLRDGALVRIVDEVLRETGLPPEALWLEITESGVMADVDAALLTLNALHALGVTLCIDDFGTGYSSLSYLHRLPVGIVKIDRSFIRDCGQAGTNEPIVRAVLAMTHAMGHRVVAEGVETETQRDWLREQGCDLVQGWLYGKADRPANLAHWIERVPA
ncbi:putative bifunctional diguanylate cyclase/phosphodiesterase [Actinoplanes sp. CA-030573]|uniref:putative bifunctional diguanylate cyclase/phosphodiesterase n=1 Tax=Actinoplanes sp. CA-030573 TaxID=3239898 RepID=UPI003D8E37D6